MNIPKQRIVFWSVIAVLFLIAMIVSFKPRPVPTDIGVAQTGSMRTSIREEGETRVEDIYTLSSPIAGHLRRINLEVGDKVVEGQTIVAEIEPLDSDFLDPRSEAQAKAEVNTAESALKLAKAELKQAQVELDFAKSEYDRIRSLHQTGTASQRDLDNSERLFKSRRAVYATVQAALQMRKFELERVKAILMSPVQSQAHRTSCECLKLYAPISGTILKVITESEGVVQAGTPLLDIGDPSQLQIVAELLSMDAVKVEAGGLVAIENWGGKTALEGKVKRIDPVGFSKVSALGIEEQRVNVIIDLVSPHESWSRLGHGYQVDVAIVLWQGSDVLQVPLTAIFREGTNWSIFVVEEGIVTKRSLQVGQINSHTAEIKKGLGTGEQFIVYPSDRIYEGVSVVER